MEESLLTVAEAAAFFIYLRAVEPYFFTVFFVGLAVYLGKEFITFMKNTPR